MSKVLVPFRLVTSEEERKREEQLRFLRARVTSLNVSLSRAFLALRRIREYVQRNGGDRKVLELVQSGLPKFEYEKRSADATSTRKEEENEGR